MRVDVVTDLVPENVEALVSFARLFETARFRRIASGGTDTGRDTDVRTLRRVMDDVLRGASTCGLPVEQTKSPVVEVPPEVVDLIEQIYEVAQDRMEEAGVGDWSAVVTALEHVLEMLQGDRRRLRRVQ